MKVGNAQDHPPLGDSVQDSTQCCKMGGVRIRNLGHNVTLNRISRRTYSKGHTDVHGQPSAHQAWTEVLNLGQLKVLVEQQGCSEQLDWYWDRVFTVTSPASMLKCTAPFALAGSNRGRQELQGRQFELRSHAEVRKPGLVSSISPLHIVPPVQPFPYRVSFSSLSSWTWSQVES